MLGEGSQQGNEALEHVIGPSSAIEVVLAHPGARPALGVKPSSDPLVSAHVACELHPPRPIEVALDVGALLQSYRKQPSTKIRIQLRLMTWSVAPPRFQAGPS
jgi:hypothetical protein